MEQERIRNLGYLLGGLGVGSLGVGAGLALISLREVAIQPLIKSLLALVALPFALLLVVNGRAQVRQARWWLQQVDARFLDWARLPPPLRPGQEAFVAQALGGAFCLLVCFCWNMLQAGLPETIIEEGAFRTLLAMAVGLCVLGVPAAVASWRSVATLPILEVESQSARRPPDPEEPLQCSMCEHALELRFAGTALGTPLRLHLCPECDGTWLPSAHLPRLSATALQALVLEVRRRGHRPAKPGQRPEPLCPVCHEGMRFMHLSFATSAEDGGQDESFRCQEHGSFRTFVQFLIASGVLKPLSGPELERLKQKVAEVRCSHCGAMVVLAQGSRCHFCEAPVSHVQSLRPA